MRIRRVEREVSEQSRKCVVILGVVQGGLLFKRQTHVTYCTETPRGLDDMATSMRTEERGQGLLEVVLLKALGSSFVCWLPTSSK